MEMASRQDDLITSQSVLCLTLGSHSFHTVLHRRESTQPRYLVLKRQTIKKEIDDLTWRCVVGGETNKECVMTRTRWHAKDSAPLSDK